MKTKQINQTAWEEVEFLDCLEKEASNNKLKIKQSEFLEEGKYPIIDQGEKFIAGYTNDRSKVYSGKLPVVIFGDHTRIFKFIDFQFALGADGVKILVPKTNLDAKYFYYSLRNLYFPTAGYSRHYKFLKTKKIPLPPLETQKKIVGIVEKAEQLKEKRKQTIEYLNDYLKSVFNEMFLKKKDKFGVKKGNELFELAYGKGLSEKERDGGEHSVYGSNGVIGNHSNFLVEGPGIIIGRKGSIGEVHFCIDNFWPIDTTYYIKPLQKINWIYLYFLLKFSNLKLNKSAAIPGLNRNDVYDLKFIDPPLELQQKFASIVERVEKLKEKQRQSLKEIEQLNGALMQKAFRGELVK